MVRKSGIENFWQKSKSEPDAHYFIAEIGNNHNGDVELAKKLIDISVEAGAHCVKFQMRDMEVLYRKEVETAEDLGVEYTKDLLKRYNLPIEDHRSLKFYAEKVGVDYMCTPWDLSSVNTLEEFGVPAYKVASADFTNLPLLDALVKTGKPLILSTGMTTQADIDAVLKFLSDHLDNIALLHCNSTYPAPLQDINLRQILKLAMHSRIVGYSGHERGISISLAAFSLGARIIERHVTLDRNMEGPDHAASLEPAELQQLIKGLNEIQLGLGTSGPRAISQGEMINRENLGKSLVAARRIKEGETIKKSDINIVSPGRGLSPLKMGELIGKVTKRELRNGEFFEERDIADQSAKLKSSYEINGNWGIPVRYHDYSYFRSILNAKMWEFHLSYKDLEHDVNGLSFSKSDAELIVHAPELFANSHLLDLTTPNHSYREQSVTNMIKVIQQTKMLKKYFGNHEPIKIVTNVGGFSMDEPLNQFERIKRYEILEESLGLIKDPEVEVIPQTMAPFPWHFGGQRYQNIFLDADEMVEWCNRLSLRLCLDTSHSKLYCTHAQKSFKQFVEKLLPYTAHIHLGDAKSINGEGLQIGEGDIDFTELFRLFKEARYANSILPEIWQGHKNNGQGFSMALEMMERYTQ